VSIEPITGVGVNRAKVKCDTCPREETVTCDYERGGRNAHWTPNIGQINSKVVSKGWAIVKGNHLCPTCEAKRKTEASLQKANEMTQTKNNVAPIRQPTPEQEVDIIVTLSSAYDRKAKRYQGQETDKTVAETVGGGVMPGWVAAIREAKFGPAGNQEVDAIRAEMAKLKADHETMIEGLRRDMDNALAILKKRLDACVAAHDRRVG
jgi:hypothetical protein